MTQEHEEVTTTDGVDAKKLSAFGGAVGTALGARRGAAGAVVGGVVGGTVGYLTGASLSGPVDPVAGTDAEPVAIDVSDAGEGGDRAETDS